ALSVCATVAETPAGSGYGQALAALAPAYQMKPEMVEAEAPGGLAVIQDETFQSETPPAWLHKPTAHDLLAVWPKSAWAKHLSGKATISCLVGLQGAIYDCAPIWETPPGESFGAAAIALTPQLLMKPGTVNGQPVVTAVNIPFVFMMPPGGGGGHGEPDGGRPTAPAAMAWLQAPSYADMAAAYPKKAREGHLSGHVTVDCSFTNLGFLSDCMTISEEPKGQGFGAAAHNLAGRFKAPAELPLKTRQAANVQLPFSFDAAVLTDATPAIGKPQWAVLPTAQETAAAFEAVIKGGVTGTVRVMLHCTVQPGGGVSGCTVAREDPAGQGVGEAALSLIPHFKITTWTIEGLPTVGGTINIPLRYEGPGKEPAPAAKP
ncbi:MAG TPA: hypothetical protein VHN39_03685, partial [Phenylobacterium sp.]|nr:hypothetical protein [Phenylobacterium sp.]